MKCQQCGGETSEYKDPDLCSWCAGDQESESVAIGTPLIMEAFGAFD